MKHFAKLWRKALGNPLMFAVFTLALIGLSLLFSTWQNLRQERQTSLQYLAMAARSVAQTVETTFNRFLRMEGHMGGWAEGRENRFWSRMSALFSGMEGESEVAFIAIIDEDGRRIFEDSRDKDYFSRLPLLKRPELSGLTELTGPDGLGEWFGLVSPDGLVDTDGGAGSLFVYARAMRSFGGGRHRRAAAPEARACMVLGLSTERNEALYRRFRNNALLQSAYVLGAAVFTWFLALRFIARRSRLHELEKSLAEAEKKAVVGALAAGVAHEIRNPLAALRGFAQYFAKKFAGLAPDEEYANTMVRESDRLNRVVTDLLYLSRDKTLEKRPVRISRLLSEVSGLLRFDLEARRVDFTSDIQLDALMADEDSLKQALLNLVLNSLDAFEDAAPPDARERVIHVRSSRSGGRVLLEVEDNGKGMAEEQKSRAFDVFFTTKAKGTGLGLSLVDKIMREHGGEARISAEPGRGCKVSLYFPEAGEKMAGPASQEAKRST
jgi:signal transduction histidine kinase